MARIEVAPLLDIGDSIERDVIVVAVLLLVATLIVFVLLWPFRPPEHLVEPGEEIVAQEHVADNTRILTVAAANRTTHRITYLYDGERYTAPFFPAVRPALDWLRQHTSRDTTIAAWWPYGHSIRGYTGRPVIATTPSYWALTNVGGNATRWDAARRGQLAPIRTVEQLATILASTSPDEAVTWMERYDATHLLLTRRSLSSFEEIWAAAHRDAENVTNIATHACRRAADGSCATVGRDVQYLVYPRTRSAGRFLVPFERVNGTYRIRGTPRLEIGRDTQIIPQVCGPTGIIRTGTGSTEIGGCTAFHPDHGHERLVYLSRRAMRSMVARLYVMDGAGTDRFVERYDDSHAAVWTLNESAGQE